MNNNGIYSGINHDKWKEYKDKENLGYLPPTSLLPNARYEMIATAFGGNGYLVNTPDELGNAFLRALEDCDRPSIINCMIEVSSSRKPQQHSWLSKNKISKI